MFRLQLAIGVSLKLPLVLHVRDAEEDALEIAVEVGHLGLWDVFGKLYDTGGAG